jgi:hypothetical protein
MTAAITGPASPRRDDDVTTTPAACPVCGTPFIPAGRQRYCSPACKQKAFRRRRPAPVWPAPALTRSARVYQCGECDQRYLGEQWCHDCNRPCRSLGPGGLCPCCDEPVAVSELQATP